jgi:glycosyltransferase involved in cell wall biosynthesis
MMKITVCVATIRPDTLAHCVRSIVGQTQADWELLLIAQGHDAQLRIACAEWSASDARIRYEHLSERGLSRARNAGVRLARGAVVAFTDDDCEAHPDWLANIACAFDGDPTLALVGGTVSPAARPRLGVGSCPAMRPTYARYDPRAGPPPDGWDWIGANVAMRREVFERVAFDECLGAGAPFPAGEDTDFKLELERIGAPMLSTPASVVDHTFGFRSGWRALLRHSQNYAIGNAAVAAKLTLRGDPRGADWVRRTRERYTIGALRAGRIHRIPINLVLLRTYVRAYRQCLNEYVVDSESGALRPKCHSTADVV